MYIRTDVHTYIRTYKRTYIRTCVPTYLRTYVRTYVHTYVRTYAYILTYLHTYILTYLHTYIHTYIQTDRQTYIHTYRHTERQRDRETERQRDRETERQRDRETERHTYILTYLHTYIRTYIQTIGYHRIPISQVAVSWWTWNVVAPWRGGCHDVSAGVEVLAAKVWVFGSWAWGENWGFHREKWEISWDFTCKDEGFRWFKQETWGFLEWTMVILPEKPTVLGNPSGDVLE